MAILIVDDEEAVLRIAERMVKRLGHEVFKAGCGTEAIEVFGANQGAIVAAIVDFNMPDMTGVECLRALRKIRPALPVILSSGYGQESLGADPSEVAAFMEKPYQLAQLSDALTKALGR